MMQSEHKQVIETGLPVQHTIKKLFLKQHNFFFFVLTNRKYLVCYGKDCGGFR